MACKLLAASFLARPNRFVVRAAVDDGHEVEAHLADPGRLRELLIPGAALRLRPTPDPPGRRTRFRVALVRSATSPFAWVSVETTRANRLAGGLLEKGRIHGIGRGWHLRREVRHGASRFDFLLERPNEARLWVEVKSVTLVEAGVARFPDAPTSRGRRHVGELARLVRGGGRALILFVVQRHDARRVVAHRRIDPDFARVLSEARRGGVLLRAARFRFDDDGVAAYAGTVRVRA